MVRQREGLVNNLIFYTAGFLLGIYIGIDHKDIVITPTQKYRIEEAYLMGCYVGMDVFISAKKMECKELNYFEEK